MACRIAELIAKAEDGRTIKERNAAKKECSDVIFNLQKLRAIEGLRAEIQRLSYRLRSESPFAPHEEEPEPKFKSRLERRLERRLVSLENLCDLEKHVCRSAHISLFPEGLAKDVVEQVKLGEDFGEEFWDLLGRRQTFLARIAEQLEMPELLSNSKRKRLAAIRVLLRQTQDERGKILAQL